MRHKHYRYTHNDSATGWPLFKHAISVTETVLRPGESQPLDAFFKAQSIAAHRPPHIPAMRMLLDVAIQETAEPPAFAARMPHLPAIQTIPERSSSGATDEVWLAP